MLEDLDEELLEQLYWTFKDDKRNRISSERDAFKYAMRAFARDAISRNSLKEELAKENLC
jgi:hypothetical protein